MTTKKPVDCWDCDGAGLFIVGGIPLDDPLSAIAEQCETCGGTGRYFDAVERAFGGGR